MPDLSSFIPKPRANLEKIHQRRLVIRGVQGMLGLFALGTVVAILWTTVISKDERRFNLTFSSVKSDDGAPVMLSPRFEGVDAEGQPYVITASQARQKGKDDAELVKVQADMQFADGRWVSVLADAGHIHIPDKQLLLTGNVQLHSDAGISFFTEEAHVDAQLGRVYGKQLVQGQGPQGAIVSRGFDLRSKEAVVRFAPGVRVRVYMVSP